MNEIDTTGLYIGKKGDFLRLVEESTLINKPLI